MKQGSAECEQLWAELDQYLKTNYGEMYGNFCYCVQHILSFHCSQLYILFHFSLKDLVKNTNEEDYLWLKK